MSLPTINFDPTKTIIPVKSFVRLIPAAGIAFAGANATDLLTVASGHGLVNDQPVLVTVATGMTGVTTNTIHYIVNSLSTTVQISTTKGGAAVNFTADGTGTLRLICDVPLKTCKYEQELENIEREVPDATDGLIVSDRILPKKRKRTYKVDVEDIKLLGAAFGNTSGDISGGSTNGNAMIWVKDPDDQATKSAIKVTNVAGNEFLAQWQTDGGQDWSSGEVSKQSLIITARELTKHTVDATS